MLCVALIIIGAGINNLHAQPNAEPSASEQILEVSQFLGVAVLAPDTLLLGAVAGNILRTTAGSDEWTLSHLPDAWGLYDMVFHGDTGLISESSRLRRSTDRGRTWNVVYPDPDSPSRQPYVNIHRFRFWDSSTVLAVGNLRSLLRSTNAGLTWTEIRGIHAKYLTGVDFFNDKTSEGIIVTHSTIVYRSTDKGSTWTDTTITVDGHSVEEFGFLDVECLDKGVCIALSIYGDLYRSTDGGCSWEKRLKRQLDFETTIFSDVEFIDNLRGVVVGYGGVFKTTDGGLTWSTVLDVGTPELLRCAFIDDNELVAVGMLGRVVQVKVDW